MQGREEADPSDGRTTVSAGTIDLLGILAASQALSSETSLDRLHSRVVQVLGEITGATDVHIVLWSDEQQDWLLPAPVDVGDTTPPWSATPRPRRCCDTSIAYANRSW